jgi:hypothetical protein
MQSCGEAQTGVGSKKISETLSIPRSTIKSVTIFFKEYATSANPPKLMAQAMRALIREATKRPKITLNELQSSTAEIGVSDHFKPYTPQSRALRKPGQENNKQTFLVFAKMHEGDSPNIWKKELWPDETKIELVFHQQCLGNWSELKE